MPLLPLFYRIAAVLMVLNAALHALTFIPDAGFNGTAQLLMPFAPLYLLLGLGALAAVADGGVVAVFHGAGGCGAGVPV